MKNKILVTGASGNVGGHIVSLLKEKGADFVAGVGSREIEGVSSIKIDYADVPSLEKSMKDIDTVFLVLPNHPNMVQWGKNIIQAAKNSGVSHVVRSSGSLAKIDSDLKIIKLLHATDEDLKKSGLDYTIIAPQFFMDNFISFFADDYKNGVLYLPAGQGKMGFIDLRDVAAVNVEVLTNPKKFSKQTLTITGEQNFSYAEAIGVMNQVLGKSTEYVAVPDEAAIEAMQGMAYPQFAIDLLISLNHTIVEGYAEEVTSTVEEITGKKPISFRSFVLDHKTTWI